MKTNDRLTIETENLLISFKLNGGNGFPDHIDVQEFGGKTTSLLCPGGNSLEVEFEDGIILTPGVFPDCDIQHYQQDGAEYVEFTGLPGMDARGKRYDSIRFSLKHEFHSDGTAFTTAFFLLDKSLTGKIIRCELKYEVAFPGFDELRWSFFPQYTDIDASVIQALNHSRHLPAGDNRSMEKGLFAMTGFYARRNAGPSLYAEFFVEGGNSVSGKRDENASSIRWITPDTARISWNFQNVPTDGFYWRNQWGWVILPACRKRGHPPFTMYHLQDNVHRYPNAAETGVIVAMKPDIVVFHESWRLDAQNGGVPFDAKVFRNLVEEFHRHGIRVAVYIRGNEISAHEDACRWFHQYLRRDYDGLYMDYGGPFCEIVKPDEAFPGGRTLFREHYLKLRRLRETIGPDGIFYSHTGPFYSALGMSFMDGYTSGEGERGLLIRGKSTHEYYSMAAVSPGTLWSAAFPEYSSAKIIPFLAAAGQYPHSPLGTAAHSSSLAHPQVPGINDLNFRPLWKLWSTFRDEKNIQYLTDFNSSGIFTPDPETGHYLMISENGRKAIQILTNFSDTAKVISTNLNLSGYEFTAIQGKTIIFDSERKAFLSDDSGTIHLDPLGVAGVLYCPRENLNDMTARLSEEEPPLSEPARAWLSAVENQRQLRENLPMGKQLFLRAAIPETLSRASYEKSLLDDLFDIRLQLLKQEKDGSYSSICWIGKNTCTKECTNDYVKESDVPSAAVPLHELLGPGLHHLRLTSIHQGEPFYSFVKVLITNEQGKTSEILFYNDLEPDRANLNFSVRL